MQLIRKIQIGLVLVVFGLLSLALPTPTEAVCGGDCSVVKVCSSEYDYEKKKYIKTCWYESACGGNGCEPVGCGPNQYECNHPSGCCTVGPVDSCPCGTKPSGVCNSCEPEPPPPEPTAIPTPVPTSTPVPTPTPVPVGTIQARAVQVSQDDTPCTAIRAVPTTSGQINNTILHFTQSSASAPPAQVQSGANYVTFANILAGWYTVDPVLPAVDWMYSRACWNNLTTGTTGEGLSQTLNANQTIVWDLGYTLGTAWLQTQGGDVYASGTVRSYIPNVTPRVFSRDGTGGFPGIVTYGTSYDLDSDPFSEGATFNKSQKMF